MTIPAAVVPLVLVPAGTFRMGSPEGVGYRDERPRHPVRLTRSLRVGVSPVTQAQWAAVVQASGVDLPAHPSRFPGSDRPVERVSWYDAVRWCNALSALEGLAPAYRVGEGEAPEVAWEPDAPGYRLPTEAEWEHLCRAGTETAYSFGDDPEGLAEHGWYDADTTHPVCQKRPNPWGLFDMHGNVSEWCWDDGSAGGNAFRPYPDAPEEDPEAPPRGEDRVSRGGSYGSPADACRSAWREWDWAWFQFPGLGFRVVRTVEEGAVSSG